MKVGRIVVVAAIVVMLGAAITGLILGLLDQELGQRSLTALTVGLGAFFIALAGLAIEKMSRRFHPESALFLWSDVDNLRKIAREASVAETREWALSLSQRIAVVLPGREQVRLGNSPSVHEHES